MSTSRIEVPLTVPPPHFDDDATIATARQVVPIDGERKIGRRKVVTLLPLLIASVLCGALGAITVNYFERRDTAATVTPQQPAPNVSTQTKTEPPVAIAPEVNAKNTETHAAVQPEDKAVTPADEPSTKNDTPKTTKRKDEEKREDPERTSAPPAPVKREPAQDASKLVRKRRVQTADSEIPSRRNRRNNAGRIEDIFTGPNP